MRESLQAGVRTGLRCLAGVLAVAAAAGLHRLVLASLFAPYLLVFPTAMIAGVLWGKWPGLVAAVTGNLLVQVWFIPPLGQIVLEPHLFVSFVVMVGSAWFLGYLGDRLRASEARLAGETGALREQLDLTTTITSNSTQAILMMNCRGYCTFMNPAAETMFGFSFDEIRARPLHDMVHYQHPDGRPYPKQECPIDRALPENFDIREHEDVFLRKNGEFFPVLVAASPIFKNGRAVATVIEVRDVTEHKRAEAALRQSELFYRQTLESIPGMVFTNTPDGTCDYVSQQWVEFTGVAADQQLGQGWVAMLHPEDRARAFAAWRAAVEERGEFDLEYRVRRADGEYEWVKVRGRAIRDQAGRIVRWFGTAVSIQDLKRAEEALRESEQRMQQALQVSRSFTFEWRPATDVVRRSESCAKILGLTGSEAEHDTGERFFQRIPPEDRARFVELLRGLQPGNGTYTTQYRVMRPDSRLVMLEETAQASFDTTGAITRLVGVTTDITARKETEEQLARAQAQLQEHARNLEELVAERTAALREVVQELEGFSYSIAHDMRAPLRSMQGFASILLEEYAPQLDREAGQYLRRIKDSALRLDQLIQDVLDYSRVVRGDLPLSWVQPERLLAEIVESYPHLHPAHITVRVESPLPDVCANPAALTQVFSNLLSNAAKFVAPDRQPQVRIWAERRGAAVRLWFADNGIGMDPLGRQRIFKMFQRLHPADHYEGTGIGLAIVRKAVERMGGAVGVESAPGEGSQFWVELPAG